MRRAKRLTKQEKSGKQIMSEGKRMTYPKRLWNVEIGE